jgi:hypothetical protein
MLVSHSVYDIVIHNNHAKQRPVFNEKGDSLRRSFSRPVSLWKSVFFFPLIIILLLVYSLCYSKLFECIFFFSSFSKRFVFCHNWVFDTGRQQPWMFQQQILEGGCCQIIVRKVWGWTIVGSVFGEATLPAR